MYRYSPISKIYIKNFRNLGEVILDFNDTPIISLIGENESGKTSVVKSIGVCGLHATPRDQKDFIRDGTKGFGVAIELKDGTVVTRMKMVAANSYSVKYPDGKSWSATKIDQLPPQVQEVMGMIEEPETKEFLHIRTYEDQLLFVTTSSSTNYKTMYNALKINQLVDAIKLGSKEANALKQSINNTTASKETFESALKDLREVDLEPLVNIEERLKEQMKVVEKLEGALGKKSEIIRKTNELGSLAKLDSVEPINISEVMLLANIKLRADKQNMLMKQLESYQQLDSLSEIQTEIESKLMGAIIRKNKLDTLNNNASALLEIDNLSEINYSLEEKVTNAVKFKARLDSLSAKLDTINTDDCAEISQKEIDALARLKHSSDLLERNSRLSDAVKPIDDWCINMTNWFKSVGVATETCPKCGESIVIDLDALESKINGGELNG